MMMDATSTDYSESAIVESIEYYKRRINSVTNGQINQ